MLKNPHQISKQVSSAKSLIVEEVQFIRSFIYNRNNKGPNVDPCGTPIWTVRRVEYELLVES